MTKKGVNQSFESHKTKKDMIPFYSGEHIKAERHKSFEKSNQIEVTFSLRGGSKSKARAESHDLP